METYRVYFLLASSQLTDEAKQLLALVADAMRLNSISRINLYGYTDSVGDATFNLTLSKERVDAVKVFLISLGVTQTRFAKAIGRGQVDSKNNNGNSVPAFLERIVTVETFI